MPERKGLLPVNVDVGLSARAELKAEVPSTSMGRLVDALTDALRPFTESRGLKADQIRLQREDVLIEIARKARERIRVDGQNSNPIPNRVLVPLLERASLADSNSEELKCAWANLLVAASIGEDRNVSIFSDTLSKLDPVHVSFLDEFGRTKSGFTNDNFLLLDDERISFLITEEYMNLSDEIAEDKKADMFSVRIKDQIYGAGSAIIAGSYQGSEIENQYPNERFPADVYYALQALSVVEIQNNKGAYARNADDIWLKTIRFTPFGFSFFMACSNVRYLRPAV